MKNMLKFSEVFKNKTFLLAFLIIAFLAVGGLVILNKTKAQNCSSYTNSMECFDAGCDWDFKTGTCKEPKTPTPTPTSTPTPSPSLCESLSMTECSARTDCVWDGANNKCITLSCSVCEQCFTAAECGALRQKGLNCSWMASGPTSGVCVSSSSCQPSQETYSNEGADWSYQSACYNASSNTSTNLNKKFVPPSSYVHLYSSSLPSMTLSNCSGSQMKTQACFVPTPNNGGFVPYFVKQASSYTFNNVCSSCTMSGAIQSSGGSTTWVQSGSVSCGTGSTAPVINLNQTTETSASAQYQHSVSVTNGSWTGYSNLSGKITQIDFSADKSKLSKLGDPVTLTFKVVNAPTIVTRRGTPHYRDKETRGTWSLEEFLDLFRGSFLNNSANSYVLLNNESKFTSSIKNIFSRLTDRQSALALESYNNQADCLAHGCDWLISGYYNEWTQGNYTCVCPGNIRISTPVPPPSSQAILAIYIGNATCKPEGDDSSCPFHPNSWYVILPPQGSNAKAPTAFLESPNSGYSIKNIFHQLFGFLLPNSQAADITTFSDTWGPVSLTVYPQSATNFYLAVWGLTGDGVGYLLSDPVQVDIATYNPWVDLKVQKSPGHEFVDGPVWINSGDDVVLKWSSNDVDSCTASASPTNNQWKGNVLLQNEGLTISDIVTSTTFMISCHGLNGSTVNDSITVTIGKTAWVNLSADINGSLNDGPVTITQGKNLTLTWTSANVTSCSASSAPLNSSWNGNVATSGTKLITNLQESTDFIITCDKGASDHVMVNVVPQTATVNIVVRLNGEALNNAAVNYVLTGPTTIQGSKSGAFNIAISSALGDSYTLTYLSGGPEGASFVGSESQSRIIKPGDEVTFYFDFSTQDLCHIDVSALYNGQPWSGKLSYLLIGPTILTGNTVPYTFPAVPPGVYYISYISGGPDNFLGVELKNALTCPAKGSITFGLKFGTSPTPTPIIPPAEIGDNPPTAKIGCVADDMINCSGTIDGDSNTPTITLYNASIDPDGDIKTCQWAVAENPSLNKTSCSPLIIGDTIGNYSVTLTVIDSKGHSSQTSIVAKVKDVTELTPKFVWDPYVPIVNKETRFFDRSLTPKGTSLKTWNWSFEGANIATSTEPNPTVIFTSIGPKKVTLTVKNSANETKTITQTIDVRAAAPEWKEVIPR